MSGEVTYKGGMKSPPPSCGILKGGKKSPPTSCGILKGGGEISPTLLSKFEGGEEISPQVEFPPRVPSWPRKTGAPLMIEKSASIHLDVFTKVNLILRRFRGGEGGTVEGFMGEPV